MNKFLLFCLSLLGSATTRAFVPTSVPTRTIPLAPSLAAASQPPSEEQLSQILREEAMNAENLKKSAKEMQNMKPEQLDAMIREIDSMPGWQKESLKKLGMDPDIMKASMEQFKQNPELLKNMGKMMDNMTPEQLLEQSRLAQEQMRQARAAAAATSSTASSRSSSSSSVVTDVEIVSEDKDKEEDNEEDDDEPIEPKPEVLDAMYEVAKIMGNGKVTFKAFCTLPVITLLSGNGEDDLDEKELKDCWNKGSLGATTVERSGFERVWREIQDNYYSDIVEEAQWRMPNPKKKRGSAIKPKPSTSTPSTIPSTIPTVGANLTPELLKKQVENISEDDITKMFENISNMSPAEEARMKAMGVDPAMMKKQAEMMKNNPLLRMAATQMIKSTPPEQLMKASQEAQEKLKNMSEAERQAFLEGRTL